MRILNFGSLNLDYVYSVNHFVKPGETLSASQQTVNPGGKGLNQSVALARAGADVYHAGVLGNGGTMLKDVLEASGVHTDFLEKRDVVQGNAVIQVKADGENCIILFGGSNQCITDEQIDRTLASFGADDWLILQNEINANARIVDKAHERSMKIVLNPSPFDSRLSDVDFAKIDWLLVNEVEAEQMTGFAQPDEAWKIIHEKWPQLSCVFTLGKNGCVAFKTADAGCVENADGTRRHDDADKAADGAVEKQVQAAFSVQAVDTTAAGDTFTGYFVAELMQGAALSRALLTAATAAAISVTRPGAAASVPTRAEVLSFLK